MGVRLAIALVLLAVTPAFAQDADAPATLRPSVRADGASPPAAGGKPAQTPAVPATPPAAPVPAYSLIPPQPTPDQCRMACAQTYYFCLAENEVQDCAPAWSQCRLACGAAASTTPAR